MLFASKTDHSSTSSGSNAAIVFGTILRLRSSKNVVFPAPDGPAITITLSDFVDIQIVQYHFTAGQGSVIWVRS